VPRQSQSVIERIRREKCVAKSKRLPAPTMPARPACVIEDAELNAMELLAAEVRLSVSSFIRVVIVESIAHPERVEEWKRIAELLVNAAPPDKPRPGRPKEPKEKKPRR
jgi:hypothetical protein